MDHHGDRLCKVGKTLSQLSNPRKSKSSPSNQVARVVRTLAILSMGIDLVGEIKPQASNGHQFIVFAVDYFSKWVEAKSLRNVTAKQMAKFIARNIICRYGMPHHVVIDNRV